MTHEELLLKVKTVKSTEELIVLAKENGIEMTEESAQAYFEQLNKKGELADDELDNVAGGGCYEIGGDRLVVTTINSCGRWICEDCERKITIRSSIDAEERIQIEVTNNGSAIPAEVAENIFTPFFTTKTDGSGIGLAVSRQIIRLHGGSLRLKHNEEGRVTFAIVVE